MSLFPGLEQREAEASALAKVASAAAVARLREREADFTPRFVARAVVEAVLRAVIVDMRDLGARSVGIEGSVYTVWPAIGASDSDQSLGARVHQDGGGPFILFHDPPHWQLLPDDPRRDPLTVPPRRRVIRVLDICAGAGVWASEVRRFAALLGFDVHITAVDYEPDERPNLERHADEVIIGDWHEGLGMVLADVAVRTVTPAGVEIEVTESRWVWGPNRREYDVIIGNPAFSHARAATRAGWPAASGPPKKEGGPPTVTRTEAKRRKHLTDAMIAAGEYGERAEYDTAGSMPALCLECAPAVVLYTTQQCYTKTSAGWLTRLDYPYAVAYEVPSSIGHRGRGEGQDDKPYSAFVWLRGRGEPTATFMLTPISDRNWDMRPGTEPDEWLEAQGIPFLRVAA
jgi:hypothetical protein